MFVSYRNFARKQQLLQGVAHTATLIICILTEPRDDELVPAFTCFLPVHTFLNGEKMDDGNHFVPFMSCTKLFDGFNGKQL